MGYITTNVDIDIDDVLDEIDTDDLIDELKRRGQDYNSVYVDADAMRALLDGIWLKRRLGKDYDAELDQLIYGVLGKVL